MKYQPPGCLIKQDIEFENSQSSKVAKTQPIDMEQYDILASTSIREKNMILELKKEKKIIEENLAKCDELRNEEIEKNNRPMGLVDNKIKELNLLQRDKSIKNDELAFKNAEISSMGNEIRMLKDRNYIQTYSIEQIKHDFHYMSYKIKNLEEEYEDNYEDNVTSMIKEITTCRMSLINPK